MFCDFHTPTGNVEDLATLVAARPARIKTCPAAPAEVRRVKDNLVRLSDLPESCSYVTKLSADFHSAFLPQTSRALDLLPRQIK
jgi:hypothetical protein